MAQSPTYSKKGFGQQFRRKSEIKEPGVYLIACEGTRDEPRYIQEFVKEMRVRAKVFIAEREAGDYGSNPRQVYDILKVNQGDTITIHLVSTDVVHGLYVDDYDISVEADPGQSVTLTFLPTYGLWFELAARRV